MYFLLWGVIPNSAQRLNLVHSHVNYVLHFFELFLGPLFSLIYLQFNSFMNKTIAFYFIKLYPIGYLKI